GGGGGPQTRREALRGPRHGGAAVAGRGQRLDRVEGGEGGAGVLGRGRGEEAGRPPQRLGRVEAVGVAGGQRLEDAPGDEEGGGGGGPGQGAVEVSRKARVALAGRAQPGPGPPPQRLPGAPAE